MPVQVKPPPPPLVPMGIPLGFFSVVSLIIIFGWAWSEAFLVVPNNWTSFFLGLAAALGAYFIAFQNWPLPRLAQALVYGLLTAAATFRFVTTHETSDADALGAVIIGFMLFCLVSVEQYRLKE